MTFYLTFGLLLWLAALIGQKSKQAETCLEVLSFLILISIAAFRFETGYDWLAYEKALEYAPPFKNLFEGSYELPLPMEVLFTGLLSLIKTMGRGITTLFVLTAAFNILCLRIIIRHFNVSFTFAAPIYFCWIYLPLQMGVVRQSISISLLELAIVAFSVRKTRMALLWFALGLGFHSSLIIFLPVFFVGLTSKLRRLAYPIVVSTLLIYALDIHIIHLFFEFIEKLNLPIVSSKISFYASIPTSSRSLAATCYFAINAAACIYLRPQETSSRGERVLWNAILLFFLAQGLFSHFPLLWNRIQYFALVAQLILWWRVQKPGWREHLELNAAAALSLCALIFQLSNPMMKPYVPYISVFSQAELSDGWERTFDYYTAALKGFRKEP